MLQSYKDGHTVNFPITSYLMELKWSRCSAYRMLYETYIESRLLSARKPKKAPRHWFSAGAIPYYLGPSFSLIDTVGTLLTSPIASEQLGGDGRS